MGAALSGKMAISGVAGAVENIASQLLDNKEGFSWGEVLFSAAISAGTLGLLDSKIAGKIDYKIRICK